jgi:hypothetical protein
MNICFNEIIRIFFFSLFSSPSKNKMNIRFNYKLNLNETDEIGIGLHPVFRILGLLAGMGSSPIIRSFIHLFFVYFCLFCM